MTTLPNALELAHLPHTAPVKLLILLRSWGDHLTRNQTVG